MATYERLMTDGAAFTPGTDKVKPAGFLADATIPPAVDDGDIGAAAMTLRRALHVSPRDESGNALDNGTGTRVNVDALVSALAGLGDILGTLLSDDTARFRGLLVSGGKLDTLGSVGALPLPSGAATAARQAAPGTVSSPSPEVVTVQPAPGLTPQRVDVVDLYEIGQQIGESLASIAEDVQRRPLQGTVAIVSNVSASTTSGIVMPANGARKGAVIYNDSLSTMYLKFGPACAGSAASAPSFTYEVPQFSHWEMSWPPYCGEIHGVWNAASGAARVTDIS